MREWNGGQGTKPRPQHNTIPWLSAFVWDWRTSTAGLFTKGGNHTTLACQMPAICFSRHAGSPSNLLELPVGIRLYIYSFNRIDLHLYKEVLSLVQKTDNIMIMTEWKWISWDWIEQNKIVQIWLKDVKIKQKAWNNMNNKIKDNNKK